MKVSIRSPLLLIGAPAASGAAMDRALPARPRWRRRLPYVLCAVVAAAALALVPVLRAARIQTLDAPQLAPVVSGEFREDLALRARVEPLRAVQLDAAEAGRVEAVSVQEGDWVEAGALLYRLHSAEQDELFMQRSADAAQQIANLSVQRSMLTASLAQGRRELARLQSGQLQAESDYRRLEPLAAAGFVPAAALEQAQRERELATALLQQGRVDQRIDAQSAQRSLSEMELAVRGLHDGLRMLERARHRLQQRAPITGRLSSFRLQVGSSVRPGDRLGRIDDPDGGLQLVAEVDEFYLPRLREGQVATSANGTLQLVQTLPQVQAGKARVVLRWPQDAATPELRPGQAVDLRLQLARPRPALLLPDGPGVQTRLYVHQNRRLLRREVQLGQRAAGQVEVLAGLHAGEVVLISQPPSDAERFALP